MVNGDWQKPEMKRGATAGIRSRARLRNTSPFQRTTLIGELRLVEDSADRLFYGVRAPCERRHGLLLHATGSRAARPHPKASYLRVAGAWCDVGQARNQHLVATKSSLVDKLHTSPARANVHRTSHIETETFQTPNTNTHTHARTHAHTHRPRTDTAHDSHDACYQSLQSISCRPLLFSHSLVIRK